MAYGYDNCTVLTTVSGKGGTGKSTVSCMLGAAFANQGYRTLLIDTDEGLRCLDLMLGVSDEVVFDLGDLLAGRCDPEQAIQPVLDIDDLFVIPAPHSPGQIGDRLGALISILRDRFDWIIVDSSAGIGEGFRSAAAVSDEVLAVVGCDPVSIRDARNVCEHLCDLTDARRRMIINRFDYAASHKTLVPHLDGIIDETAIQLVGIVPFDENLTAGNLRGRLILRGHAWRAFVRIAHRLNGEDIHLPKLTQI